MYKQMSLIAMIISISNVSMTIKNKTILIQRYPFF